MGLNITNQLRAQLIEANKVLDENIHKNRQYKWPKHNEPSSQLDEIYQLVTKNEPEDALNLLYSLTNKKNTTGEIYYLEGLCFLKLRNYYKAIENLNKANDLDFCTGNIIKYVLRHNLKNGVEDLKKAKQYIDFLIEKKIEKSKKV